MTWQVVANKDFQDALRSRWLLGLSLFFVGFIGGVPSLIFGYYAPEGLSSADLFGAAAGLPLLGISLSFSGIIAFVIAFIALVTAHGSVIDERDSGTLKLLLSLPHSRLDAVLGKFAGRTAVIALPVLAGFFVAIVGLYATNTTVELTTLLPQVALTVLVAAAFVSLGVGLSASAETNRQATLGVFGLYFLLAFLWSLVAQGFPALVNAALRRLPGVEPLGNVATVEFRLFVKYLNPLRAYETLVATLYRDTEFSARMVKAGFFEQRALANQYCPEGLSQTSGQLCAGGLQPSVPPYLSDAFIFVIFLLWIAVPVALGYRAFRGVDL